MVQLIWNYWDQTYILTSAESKNVKLKNNEFEIKDLNMRLFKQHSLKLSVRHGDLLDKYTFLETQFTFTRKKGSLLNKNIYRRLNKVVEYLKQASTEFNFSKGLCVKIFNFYSEEYPKRLKIRSYMSTLLVFEVTLMFLSGFVYYVA